MKKIISILTLALVVFSTANINAKTSKTSHKKGVSSSKTHKKKRNNSKSSVINTYSGSSDVIKILDINDFNPILKYFPNSEGKVKKITIYYLDGERGMGTLGQDLPDFINATNLNEAKEKDPSEYIFEFSKNQRLEKFDYSLGTFTFTYDNDGKPIKVKESEWGYRWSPDYDVQYNITWKDDNTVFVKRDIDHFNCELGLNNETLPFSLDFADKYIFSDVISTLKSNSTEVKQFKNALRIKRKTNDDDYVSDEEGNIAYWIELECY